MDENLLSFIQGAQQAGSSRDQIKEQLLSVGWEATTVDQALITFFGQQDAPPVDISVENIEPSSESMSQLEPPAETPDQYVGMFSTNSSNSSQRQSEMTGMWNQYSQNTSSAPRVVIQPKNTQEPSLAYSVNNTPHQKIVLTESHPMQRAVKIASGLVAGLVVMMGVIYGYNRFIASPAVETAPNTSAQNIVFNGGLKTEIYTNYKYNFKLALPADWARKEYDPKDFGGEARFAFGLADDLPKDFFAEGKYVWMRVRHAEGKELDEFNYLLSQSAFGTNQKTALGGDEAVDTGVVIMSNHKGYLYSLYLNRVIDEEGRSIYTPLSKQIWESFAFLE